MMMTIFHFPILTRYFMHQCKWQHHSNFASVINLFLNQTPLWGKFPKTVYLTDFSTYMLVTCIYASSTLLPLHHISTMMMMMMRKRVLMLSQHLLYQHIVCVLFRSKIYTIFSYIPMSYWDLPWMEKANMHTTSCLITKMTLYNTHKLLYSNCYTVKLHTIFTFIIIIIDRVHLHPQILLNTQDNWNIMPDMNLK